MTARKTKYLMAARAALLLGAGSAAGCGALFGAGLDADWALIPAGDTLLGHYTEDWCALPDSDFPSQPPYRWERVEQPFTMLPTEVSQRLFREHMGYDPSSHREPDPNLMLGHCLGLPSEGEIVECARQVLEGEIPEGFLFCRGDCPVETVTWHEAAAFCNRLSEADGREPCYRCHGEGSELRCAARQDIDPVADCHGYRLPTELEWEHAARAGARGDLYPDLPVPPLDDAALAPALDYVWSAENSDGGPHAVGQLRPNAWGVHDMLGNVAEWCHDAQTMERGAEQLRQRVAYYQAELEAWPPEKELDPLEWSRRFRPGTLHVPSPEQDMRHQIETTLEMNESFLGQYEQALARGCRAVRGGSSQGGLSFMGFWMGQIATREAAQPLVGFRPIRVLHDER